MARTITLQESSFNVVKCAFHKNMVTRNWRQYAMGEEKISLTLITFSSKDISVALIWRQAYCNGGNHKRQHMFPFQMLLFYSMLRSNEPISVTILSTTKNLQSPPKESTWKLDEYSKFRGTRTVLRAAPYSLHSENWYSHWGLRSRFKVAAWSILTWDDSIWKSFENNEYTQNNGSVS